MRLVVERNKFLKLLQKIQTVIDKNPPMSVLSHTLLEAKDNQLDVLATDLELSFKGSCEAEVENSGQIVVPARALYNIIRSLKEEKVELKEDENGWLKITAGKSHFSLVSMPVEEFPVFPDMEAINTVAVFPNVFRKALMKTYFSIAKEDVNPNYAGLCLEKITEPEPKLRFVSTDTFRLTYMEIPFPCLEELQFENKIMIPRKAVIEMLRLTDSEKLFIGFDNQAGVIKTENTLLYVRLMENKFPQYQSLIPESCEYKAIINKDVLKDILKRIVVIMTEKTKVADFIFSSKNLSIRAENTSVGTAEETMEVVEFLKEKGDKDELKMTFNISFLLDVLNVMESEFFSFGLNTERLPCVITGEKDIGFKSLIAPVIEKES